MGIKSEKSIIECCRVKIQEKLGLRKKPKIEISIRKLKGPDGRGAYSLPKHDIVVNESIELSNDTQSFDKAISQFREQYYSLYRNTLKQSIYKIYLIEPLVHLGKATVAGGFNWIIMGILNDGKKYAAILEVEVRPIMRKCGLMTLMKHEEIKLAERKKCDFIHTWHWSENPFFVSAIASGFSTGFVLYHGKKENGEDDGEGYENDGYVHLRYYFDRKAKNVRVLFTDGTEFKSPRDNDDILKHLKKINKTYPYPGRKIKKIEATE